MSNYTSANSALLQIVSSKFSDARSLADSIEFFGIRTQITDSIMPLFHSKVLLYKSKHIIDQNTIGKFGSHNIINLHSGKLPQYRGLNALSWMIQNGESSGALTLHEVEHIVDTGAIISEFIFSLSESMDINDAQKIVSTALKSWLPLELVRWFHNKNINKIYNRKKYKMYPAKKDDNFFDNNWRMKDVINLIRAVNPPYGPGAIYQDNYKNYRVAVAFGPESTKLIEKKCIGSIKCKLRDGVLELKILPI